MWLPTQAQVNAFTRNLASGIGGAVLMLGLSNKIDTSAVSQIIAAAGNVVNDIVVLLTLATPVIAGYFASKSASPAAQAAAIGANAQTTVQPGPNGTATVTLTNGMAKAAIAADKGA